MFSELCRACGITAQKITHAEDAAPDLFGMMKRDEEKANLFLAVDRINRKYGSGSVRMSGAFVKPVYDRKVRFLYPVVVAS